MKVKLWLPLVAATVVLLQVASVQAKEAKPEVKAAAKPAAKSAAKA